MLGCGFQRDCDDHIGAFRGERQVPGLLLDIRNHAGQRPVNGTPLPDRRLLVADRGEQRMRETDLGVVQDDDALSDGCVESSQDAIPVSLGRGDDSTFGRASAATSSNTSSVSPGRRARRPPSSSRRLSGTRSAWPGAGRVFRADQFPAKLQCEERVAGGRFLYTCQLGPFSSSPSRSSRRR